MKRTPTAIALVLGLTVLGLTGCSVGFTPESPAGAGAGAEAGAGARAGAGAGAGAGTDAGAATGAPDATADADGAGASGDTVTDAGPSAAFGDIRSKFVALSSSVTCPDGSLVIDQVAAVVHVTEPCEAITVTGSSAVVIAEKVGTLTVSSTAALVSVAEVSSIVVTEDSVSSIVQWSAGDPSIVDDGMVSSIAKVGQ